MTKEPCENYISRVDVLNMLKGIEILHHHDELRTNLIYGIMNLPSVQPQQVWIPVSERMPEKEGFYLVSIEVMENPPQITTFTGISQYIAHDEFLGEVNNFNRENVIAWMPLPTPYNAERSSEE